MEDFDKTLMAANVKAVMKEAQAISADLWQIDPRKLLVLKNFNARVRNDAYLARVRKIADSIKANGFYKSKPPTSQNKPAYLPGCNQS